MADIIASVKKGLALMPFLPAQSANPWYNWSGRADLNRRPHAPETDSDHFLKPLIIKQKRTLPTFEPLLTCYHNCHFCSKKL